jgi:caffeoyl-CoA O-methyltransferase
MNPFEFPEKILRYAETHTSDEDPLLRELYRTTYLKTVYPQMISGKVQGQFLSFISQMVRPRRILEIGTFTGYSAYCLAKGLQPDGKVVTIEVNEELEELIRDFFEKADIADRIELLIGDALEILPRLGENFDLVFIDANKDQYGAYYGHCVNALNSGGYLVADNVLWGGKVAEEPLPDETTRSIHQFNALVQNDPRVENVFLTIRDGLLLVRKK